MNTSYLCDVAASASSVTLERQIIRFRESRDLFLYTCPDSVQLSLGMFIAIHVCIVQLDI